MTISTTITQTNNTNSTGCIVNGQPFVVTPTFTLDTPPGCDFSTLLYELYDNLGVLLDSQSYQITNATPEDPSTLTYTYTQAAVGDLKLVTTLTECSTIVTEIKIIQVCDYLVITQPVCHSFSFHNGSLSTTVYATFTKKDGTVIGSALQSVAAAGSLTLTTSLDGIYYLNVYSDSGGTTLIGKYIIVDHCDIDDCLSDRALNILCSDCSTSKCSDYCKKVYELIQIEILAFIFYNKVNREYSLNRVYSTIDTVKAAELDDLDSIITQLGKYCSACTSTVAISSASVSKTSTGDCGCGS